MFLKRILLIDEDVDEHDIFATAIKEIGNEFSFNAVTCARQALQALRSFELKPDIIFLDLNLRGMTAEDFLFGLEAFEPLQAIPVIIYSGSLNLSNISPGWPGVKYALKKPASFLQLIEALDYILKSGQALIKK